MTPSECVQVVTLLAARCPSMRIEDATPDAWYIDLQHHDALDGRDAVLNLSRELKYVSLAELLGEIQRIERQRLGRQRRLELDREMAAIEAAPLPDDRPVVPLNREKPLKAGHRLEPPDYADKDAMERRRQRFLRELAEMGSQS